MTKVLLLVDGYPGKENYANIFIKNQAIALKSAGFDIAVLIVDIRSIRRFRRFGIYREITEVIPTWRVSIPWGPFFLRTGQQFANFLACRAFQKVQKVFGKPDLLHAHFGEVGILGARLKKKHHIPLVITEHGSLMLPGNGSIERKNRVMNEAYRNCDKLIAVGTNLARHIKLLGFDNLTVIPNIIPALFFNREHNLIKKKKQFISVGSLLPGKRFDLTISAFARLCEIVRDIELVIVGTGPLYDTLLRMIAEKKIAEKVFFHGFIQNNKLPALYMESVCFVLPSDFETFGVVYAEALACGIPAIATRCGGPQDIINDENGLLIPRNDEDALFNAMLYMVQNSVKYDPVKISNDIANRFGEKAITEKISGVYSDILKRSI